MKKTGLFILLGVLTALAATLFFRNPAPPRQPQTSLQKVGTPAPPQAVPSNLLPHSLPSMEPVQKPLPLLENADEEGQQWLARLFPQIRLEEVFFLDHVIERLVLLVHSLTESKLPLDKVSLRTASGPFRVQTEPEKIFISAENSRRYAPFTRLAEQLDSDTAVAAYQRLYPLLQQAYEELGVSTGTFHQRLLEVIDHLLATPEVKGPIALVQPHVLYQFADPELEALSAGQKILLRIGPENAAAVKGKLRELRSRLVR